MTHEEIFKVLYSEELYDPGEPSLMALQLSCLGPMEELNRTDSSQEGMKRREELFKEMFGACGEGCYIQPPFFANWGGRNMYLGDHVYANAGMRAVDDGKIVVGDHVMFGPGVTLATAIHPISPNLRKYELQYNLPITIGSGVWIGAGVIIQGGVTIGENSVIGAGSVVTRDIPANVVAFGSPCRVVREITEEDYRTYDHGREIPEAFRSMA